MNPKLITELIAKHGVPWVIVGWVVWTLLGGVSTGVANMERMFVDHVAVSVRTLKVLEDYLWLDCVDKANRNVTRISQCNEIRERDRQ